MPGPSDPRREGEGTEAAPPAVLLTLPNLITLARICAVPATIWLILQHRLDWAFLVFVGAGISDGVDGWLARVLNARSALGAMLDPVADKALLVSVYVALAAIGVLPDWLAILVVFRDMVIVGGVLVFWVLGQPQTIRPLFVSKLNTVLQIGLAALALLLAGFGLSAHGLLTAMIWAVAATTLGSGAAYVAATLRRPRAGAGGP
ncbi:CDP-alcohol phosphatidyltransferase family protein [Roseicella aerolata]|uniref:CDP-diacylglycerol--glycerol-3-phosphate 3-phosphatidyltransferase n=1 Tax=Roseicella aerolata TaxID=2883479 RepID=A0A9X1LCW7_9PROT|nr:CDP-alcohol phosphatidyltransferase family protein [Roseicella aerolata]MCB4824620.1 CDP-alcohol phosphatidyltransferase family protein [Roseicella aerolata]